MTVSVLLLKKVFTLTLAGATLATTAVSPAVARRSSPSRPTAQSVTPQAPAADAELDQAALPVAIEPFIRPDAVALGQWLVARKMQAWAGTEPPGEPAAPPPQAARGEAVASSPRQTPADVTPPVPKVQVRPPQPSNGPTIDSHLEMRVALTKAADRVAIATADSGALVGLDGTLVQNLPAGMAYQVQADASGMYVDGKPAPTALWVQPDSSYVALGNSWYRGRLLLLWRDGAIMVVNYVPLQDYLYSVVGAEMSASWSIEALKAQAVAARSYAIVHSVRHRRRSYDLDDTPRYQAYRGVATEASSTHQAVHDTSGEYISYGEGVVESLYAATQDIVNDAHSGYGMSQMGALDLARQGYRYYEILAAYYPDTSVGRIDIDG